MAGGRKRTLTGFFKLNDLLPPAEVQRVRVGIFRGYGEVRGSERTHAIFELVDGGLDFIEDAHYLMEHILATEPPPDV